MKRLVILIISAVAIGLFAGAFATAASPDLIISGIVRAPATPSEGAWVSFDAYVQNVGSDTAAESVTRFRLDQGGDGSWDTTITQPIRAVTPGATEVASFRLTVGAAGLYRSEFCADTGGAVFESNEFNNCLTENFEVRAAEQPRPQPTVDLKVNSSDGPITVPFNSAATLSWTSANASSCFASGGWSGSKGLSGSETAGPLTSSRIFTLTCDGVSDSVSVNVTGQPPATVDLKINGSDGTINVNSGTSAVLSWTSSNASSCIASGGWSGFRPTSGSESTGTLTSFQTFTLTCDSASDSVTANVTSPPINLPTVSLTASPGSVNRGDGAILTWNSTNADSCFASGGWSGFRAASGSEFVFPSQTTTYTLTCSNAAGSRSASITFTVTDVLPTVNLTVSPSSIRRGETTVLTWSSTNADSCFASGGWSGARVRSGSETVFPSSTTSYFLTCLNDSTSSTASATVFVGTTLNRPNVSFSVTPASIIRGESAILAWSTFNADNCFASGGWSGFKALSGSEIASPSQTTTYAITCSNSDGSTSVSRTLTVFEPTPATPARFTAACVTSPSRAAVGQSVTFAGGETGGVAPVTFNWSGAISGTGLTRTVSFSTAGAKTALLTVVDSNGRSATASCAVDIVAPTPAAPAAPTAPTAPATPTAPQPPVTLTFRNVPTPEAPAVEEERSLLATIFGEGLGRLLAILFIILANIALLFFLYWLYQRAKKEKRGAALPARLPVSDRGLPQDFLEPEIS